MIEVIGTEFDVDTLAVQAKMFEKYANAATSADAIAMGLNGGKELINRALTEDRYDVALAVIESATSLCERATGASDSEEFGKKRAEVKRLERLWQQVRAAKETLKSDPENPEASLTVGRWIWFQKGDAKRGLSYLAKGSDGALQSLAKQELTLQSTDPDALVSLANAWWELSRKQTGEAQEPLARHAGEWYKMALPKLSEGLTKVLVQRRLEELASPKAPEAESAAKESGNTSGEAAASGDAIPHGRWVELLPLVDLKRDTVSGVWERKGDSLLTKRAKLNSTMLLPVIADGDYRLEVQFTRTDGQDAIAIIILVGGKPCLLTFSESSGKTSRLAINAAAGPAQRANQVHVEPGTLTNNEKHTASVLVRLNGNMAYVHVLLDGKSYLKWSGDPNIVCTEGWPALPAKQFALGTNESVVFHSVRLWAISGKATLAAPAHKGDQARASKSHAPSI
jgi:hypothetical protein